MEDAALEELYLQEVSSKTLAVDGHFEFSCAVSKHQKLVIIASYRPPSGNLDVFLGALENLLYELSTSYKKYKMLLSGDFNLCLLKRDRVSEKFTAAELQST
ncbi:hypothetical protein HHI36_008554 [Cryptolaemus montrouzieri]|uniref:Endonuclease/exonuclease/phosphatase domain-containing protein n=1 Tax=Cryptolaemus montrouzieri TaxID=559131 RepID=A0ABD2MTC8_9CUCU